MTSSSLRRVMWFLQVPTGVYFGSNIAELGSNLWFKIHPVVLAKKHKFKNDHEFLHRVLVQDMFQCKHTLKSASNWEKSFVLAIAVVLVGKFLSFSPMWEEISLLLAYVGKVSLLCTYMRNSFSPSHVCEKEFLAFLLCEKKFLTLIASYCSIP